MLGRSGNKSALSPFDAPQERTIAVLKGYGTGTAVPGRTCGQVWRGFAEVGLGLGASAGERIHDRCFVCGPKGNHYQPPLPPYPEEWEYFILDRKTASTSRKLNNIFSLTAIGVYDGDFMKFPAGIASVTLAGGRTYHRILPAHEGQHAIRWFIHDPWGMIMKGAEFEIPHTWIQTTLAG
ncbi:hypothetical protein B0H13DRAFT_1855559 [Mycena leptocephala]|nr:hypothetical protein B0H13DRAFT_1855559 [Mycena leptocephala]